MNNLKYLQKHPNVIDNWNLFSVKHFGNKVFTRSTFHTRECI